MVTGVYIPPPAFSFTVAVAGSGTALQLLSGADASFQEVSGVDAKIEVETVIEGGENRFAHQLPGVTKSPNLVLRRGYVTAPSFLAEWAAQTVGSTLNEPILTQTIVVMLLGPNRIPLVAWTFDRAWPVRWVTGPFDSKKNDVLTEVLEFSYSTVTRMPLNEAVSMVPAVSALIGY
ncbi:phage tail protein [Sphingomonas sp. QA11]|uniref:phage tail protein n=1 Tax=Sphingomonas sp. QA11 TaxID=2950605 RepID=UPI00234A2FF1|nr:MULTISPECIES: phage tail protein [unclassified Sphingomonas]WCM25663.1 phage tail protein [Sphingomonas sp. QA11]WEJ99551.1 MAG: phage tail protein [Sphingomonas sp.]